MSATSLANLVAKLVVNSAPEPLLLVPSQADSPASITDTLIKERFSCRFFLDKEVKRQTIEEIIDVARFSPSGNNIQPWAQVYCVSGERLKSIQLDVLAAFTAPASAAQSPLVLYEAEYKYYPPLDKMPEPYASRRQEFGRLLGKTLGIDRMDAEARAKAAGRNYEFYGAPAAMVFTVSKRLETGSWMDLGYFLQSISIAARSRGLETCNQESLAKYHSILREHLPISDDETVAVTMCIGYPDREMATRCMLTPPRREVGEILQFHA